MARCRRRWAITLLELAVVLAIVGLVASAAIGRYGFATLENAGAEGFARKIAWSLIQARRSTIATGDNHYLQFNTDSGSITSLAVYRRVAGGDIPLDRVYSVPTNVTVTSADNALEFNFEGAALSSYNISVTGPDRSWTINVAPLTGAVQMVEIL